MHQAVPIDCQFFYFALIVIAYKLSNGPSHKASRSGKGHALTKLDIDVPLHPIKEAVCFC
eukprot:2000181-Ditylum_brightwellii.AAC.1